MSVHKVPNGYAVRWREGDRNRSRTLRTKNLAEIFERHIKDKKQLGAAELLPSERNFWDMAEEWWRSHHRTLRSEMTKTNQRTYLEGRVRDEFGNLRLCDIRGIDIEEWLNRMEREGVGRETRRKIVYVLSGVFEHALRMGYINHNPCRVVRKPRTGRQRLIQPFPPERVEALRSWCLGRDDLESATLISVLAYAGPRPAEAHAYLTWGDILPDRIIFRGEKNQRDRVTRLLSPLDEDLTLWRAEGPREIGPVFDWTVSQFNNWRGRVFAKAVKELGIGPTRPYDLRHAFATLLAAEGRSIDYLAKQLGHSHPTCTRWYRHLIEDMDGEVPAEERIYAARGVPQTFSDQRTADSP